MITLGKKAITNTKLLRVNDLVTIGDHIYAIGLYEEGWFLDGRASGVSNAQPFNDLHVSPGLWCITHKIYPLRSGGTFPWMSQEDISKAVALLQKEIPKKK